jgi:hypothetical protein
MEAQGALNSQLVNALSKPKSSENNDWMPPKVKIASIFITALIVGASSLFVCHNMLITKGRRGICH